MMIMMIVFWALITVAVVVAFAGWSVRERIAAVLRAGDFAPEVRARRN